MIESQSLRNRVVAGLPVPHDGCGEIAWSAFERIIEWVGQGGVDGVVVWTRIGRGNELDEAGRIGVIERARRRSGEGKILVAAIGPSREERRPDRVRDEVVRRSNQAREHGADLLLALPPSVFRGRPDEDRLVLEYHAAIGEVGLPVVVSYATDGSGGIAYRPDVLSQMVARPEVVGVHLTTPESLTSHQDVGAILREVAPEKVLISGQERFVGYSLMTGASALMLGLASAFPGVVAELARYHKEGDAARFLRATATVDDLARQVMIAPTEATAQRLLWCLALQGVIDRDVAFDPWAARIGGAEFERLRRDLARRGQLRSES